MKMWLTRDKNGEVYLWQTKPEKNKREGFWASGNIFWQHLFWADHDAEFEEVKWEDEEPTEVEFNLVKIKKGE